MARRASEWFDTIISFDIPSGTEVTLGLSKQSAGGTSEGYTVIRLLAFLNFIPAAIPTAVGYQIMDVGVGVATEDAITGGALPNLRTTDDRPIGDWMWRDQKIISVDNADTTRPTMLRIDAKSQRKLAGGQMFLAVDNTATVGTDFTVRLRGLIRALVLQP